MCYICCGDRACDGRSWSQASEVEETLKRIRSHRGVEGILIVNNDGVSLKSTLSAELTTQYASLFAQVRAGRCVVGCGLGQCVGLQVLVGNCCKSCPGQRAPPPPPCPPSSPRRGMPLCLVPPVSTIYCMFRWERET